MRQLAFTVQKGGIDRQRIKGNARADTAYDLVNGYVSNAGTVVNRDGTLRDAILPATTRGLVGFEDLLHTFSYQLEQYTPVGYLANVLAHPTDETATLTEIHFAAPFMGALYVVAEWSDGGVFHYWLASSGEWAADAVYLEGDVVTPTEPNGLLYKATPNNPAAPTQSWQPLTNYNIGDKVLPVTYDGYYFEVTATQGDVPISGSIEPTWNATEDAETTESVDGVGAPASNTGAGATSQVPPPIQDRYGTGGTDLSTAAQSAVNLSDTVASWAPGTLYQPGALVKPLSAAPVINSAIPNAGFESGDHNWTKGTGWHITNASTGADGNKPYQGTWFAKWLAVESTDLNIDYLEMATKVPVIAGQFLSASCYESRDADEINSRLLLRWYDAYDVLVKETVGSTSDTNHHKDYRVFTVQDSTPGGAVKVSVAFSAQRQFSFGEGQICVDSFVWDYVNLTPAEADFTIYQAVQAAAATSGTVEPTWPGAGNTVVDGGVTWLGGVTSVITWTARPIMKSGSAEPAHWNEDPSYTHPGSTSDNTITWQTTTGYIPDAPNSKYVALAAKKIFAGDDDIVKYSATVNPIDWTTAQDAGYLPTGLNTYGANPVRALGLYRGNLIPFNSAGFQMWQVDPDPELMQLLDAEPIGSTYHKALQAVKNDLIFLTQLGYRSLSIAGGASNLQANDIGNPVDSLVQAKLRANVFTPNSMYYPARGQYWGWFGPDVFVCTFNDAGRSWSRYVFPEALTDATLLNNDLYLRTALHKVWKVSADALQDDIHELPAPFITASQTPGDPVTVEWGIAGITAGDIDGWRLYKSVNGAAFALVETVVPATTLYEDFTSYIEGDQVRYYVDAYKGADTDSSDIAAVTISLTYVVEYDAAGSYTFDPPSAATSYDVVVCAGGGGGNGGGCGGSGTYDSAGSGGSGGGLSMAMLGPSTVGTGPIVIVVGAGGMGGPPSTTFQGGATQGANGGDSSFGALLTASGGKAPIGDAPQVGGVGTTENGGDGARGYADGTTGAAGGSTVLAPAGGGGGGSDTQFSNIPSSGGPGGSMSDPIYGHAGGAAGTPFTPAQTGGHGGVGGISAPIALCGSGGGGGGSGAPNKPLHPSLIDCSGGSGGSSIRGGGGGGGGFAALGFPSSQSGAGGNGGTGFVRITVHL